MKKSLLLTLVLFMSINCFGQIGGFERSKEGKFTFQSTFLRGVVPNYLEDGINLSFNLELIGKDPSLVFYVSRRVDDMRVSKFILVNNYMINIVDIAGFKIITSNGSIQCRNLDNKDKGDFVDDFSEKTEYYTYNELRLKLSPVDLKILRDLPKSGFKLEMLINHYNNNIQSIMIEVKNSIEVSAILSNSARQLEILKELDL